MLYKNKPFVQISNLKTLMERPDYIEVKIINVFWYFHLFLGYYMHVQQIW
jgi:hypothetical protein